MDKILIPRHLRLRKAQGSSLKRKARDSPNDVAESRPSKRSKATPDKPIELERSYAEELVCGLELLFSDYVFKEQGDAWKWLKDRGRRVDGQDDYIHLSAFLDHPIFSRTKPIVTQKALQKAIQAVPSQVVKVSNDGYHIQRAIDSSTQLHEFDVDSCTIYVEPDIRTLCSNFPKLVQHMKSKSSILGPSNTVQHVATHHHAWAFITLSKPVTEEQSRNEELWPSSWIVLTKAEWKRRDDEYKALKFGPPKDVQEQALPQSALREPSVQGQPMHGEDEGGHPDATKRLIIFLENVHPDATKSTVQAFVARNVDKAMKARSKQRSNDSSAKNLQIAYVDHKKGSSTCYLRLAPESPISAQEVVDALDKRKRRMGSSDDSRGQKADGDAEWVQGKVLVGKAEQFYWENSVWKKSKKGARNGNYDLDVEPSYEDGVEQTTNFATATKISRRHIKYDD